MLRGLATCAGLALILVALVDCFNTIVLPRRVGRLFGLTSLFYRITWSTFSGVGRRIRNGRRREEFLSIYGPLSLLSLLMFWALCIVVGFGFLHWAAHVQLDGHDGNFASALYVSASSIVTIAIAQPANSMSRWLVTVDAGLGFGLFGLVVGYLPMLYQSYSSRELQISLLDARAGSPPTAGELLLRQANKPDKLEGQLADWEKWTAEVLDEQLSYSMLA